jgi:hypothetical protein
MLRRPPHNTGAVYTAVGRGVWGAACLSLTEAIDVG